ncbi:MAG: hypothetical protein AAFS07_19395, partial [Pseudomonadota bacterium]
MALDCLGRLSDSPEVRSQLVAGGALPLLAKLLALTRQARAGAAPAAATTAAAVVGMFGHGAQQQRYARDVGEGDAAGEVAGVE